MGNLRRTSSISLLIVAFISGCQTPQSFKITTLEKGELHIVEIDTNRIIQECHFMNAEKENNWRHQYVLYLINEKNEVIPVYNPTNQGKAECLAHLNKVEKVLKKAPRVRLCVRDELEKIIDTPASFETHNFGLLGKHKSTYYGLTFDTICNSNECYGISDTWTYTCPGFK